MPGKITISGEENPRVNESPLYELKIGTKTIKEDNNVLYRWVMYRVDERSLISKETMISLSINSLLMKKQK